LVRQGCVGGRCGRAGSGPRLLLDVSAPVEQQRERLLLPKQNKRMNRNKTNE